MPRLLVVTSGAAGSTSFPPPPPPPPPILLSSIDPLTNNILVNGVPVLIIQGTGFDTCTGISGGYTIAQQNAINALYKPMMNCIHAPWDCFTVDMTGIYKHGGCLRLDTGHPPAVNWRTDPDTWSAAGIAAINTIFQTHNPDPSWIASWIDGEYDVWETSLTSAITAANASIPVAVSDAGHPGQYDWSFGEASPPTISPPFLIQIDLEVLQVTAISGTTWTVLRGVKGTVAAPHASGARVSYDVGSYTASAAFIRTLDPQSRLQCTYLTTSGNGGGSSFVPNNNQVPFFELVLNVGDPWTGTSKGYGHMKTMNAPVLAASYPPGAGFCPAVSTTPCKELILSGQASRARSYAELRRFMWFQVAFNCRAFDMLWGPITRDTTYVCAQDGDGSLSPDMITLLKTWTPNVLNEIYGFQTQILAAGNWTTIPATAPNTFIEWTSADTPYILASGVFVAKKMIGGTTYLIAINCNEAWAPQDTFLGGRAFTVTPTGGPTGALTGSYAFAFSYVLPDGETALSNTTSSFTSFTAENAQLTGFPVTGNPRIPHGTTAMNVYGMKSGGTDFQLIAQRTDFSTNTYTVTTDVPSWTTVAPVTPGTAVTVSTTAGPGLTGDYYVTWRWILKNGGSIYGTNSRSGLSPASASVSPSNQTIHVSGLPTSWPAWAAGINVCTLKRGTNVLTATPGSGGSLPNGTYYYVVEGSTHGRIIGLTTEVSATAAAGNIALSWPAFASAYCVYRGTAPGKEYTLFRLVGTSLTDNRATYGGAGFGAGAAPGQTPYVIAATLNSPSATVDISSDPTPDNNMWLYKDTADNGALYGNVAMETALTGVSIDVGQTINAVTRTAGESGSPSFTGSVLTDDFTPMQVHVYQVT